MVLNLSHLSNQSLMRLLGNGEVSYYYSYRKLSHNVDKTSFNQKKWTAVMEMWCKKMSFTGGKK